jgi:D-allose transport system substrate-binding protein
MNKLIKLVGAATCGLMLSTVAARAAADYAVVLKTLSNPYWVEMKQGV